MTTLHDCLREYCKQEQLDASERWTCSHCKKRVRALKQLCISRAPEILIVHLKRFKMDQSHHSSSMRLVKDETNVQFPADEHERLDLSAYMAQFGSQRAQYRLYAVSQHLGSSMRFGHYTAAARNHQDGNWYQFNDTFAQRLPGRPSRLVVNSKAYVLFYERVDDDPIVDGGVDMRDDAGRGGRTDHQRRPPPMSLRGGAQRVPQMHSVVV